MSSIPYYTPSSVVANLDPTDRSAILGGPSVLPLPTGAAIPRCLKGSPEEIAAVTQVMSEGLLGGDGGPWQTRAAQRFTETFKVRFFWPAANGSLVITLALKALGVKEGDSAYMPASTFQATAGACYDMKVAPVLAEVLADNGTIDPQWLRADIARRKRAGEQIPKVIIAVALYSQPPDMQALREIADEHAMWLVLDFAHGPYAELLGRPITDWADVVTYSFQQSKSLGLGEGGGISTNDDLLRPIIRQLISCGYFPWDMFGVSGPGYGMPPQTFELPEGYETKKQSVNYRMTELQAAVLYHRIPRLVEMQRIAVHTIELLDEIIAGFPFLTPHVPVDGVTVRCFYKWGCSVDPDFMEVNRFRAALWKELNHEAIFSYPALSLDDNRNPLRVNELADWITDKQYLASVSAPTHHPIAEDAISKTVMWEWQFLLLGQLAADALRVALLKIAHDRDAINQVELPF